MRFNHESAPTPQKPLTFDELVEQRENQRRTECRNHNQALLALYLWHLENGKDEGKMRLDDEKKRDDAMMMWIERGHNVRYDNFIKASEYVTRKIDPNDAGEIQKALSEVEKYPADAAQH